MTLTAQNVTLTYPGGKTAVRGASIEVAPGSVTALLGGNGAGKSSLMKVIAGAIAPTSGQVTLTRDDDAIVDGADDELLREVTGYCPDANCLPPALTLREVVGVALASTDHLACWPVALGLLGTLGLAERLDQECSTFSNGTARRASVALAVLTSSQVLLLDEPFDAVDELGNEVIVSLIDRARSAGLRVLVTTHERAMALRVADRVEVMRDGQLVARLAPSLLEGDAGGALLRDLLAGAHA